MIRTAILLGALLFALSASAQSIGGMSGIGPGIGGSAGNGAGSSCTGTIDLSTGCAQLVAFGAIF